MKNKTPVYPHPHSYALEHNELDAYRASHQANVACKEAIETAIGKHYHNNCLGKGAVKEVLAQFGYDRVFHVLAATVRHKEWDGRISSDNKKWAWTVPISKDVDEWKRDRNIYFVVDNASPGLTDIFLTAARQAKLLATPLKVADIKVEALRLMNQFKNMQMPDNSDDTHFSVRVSPDFLARAKEKDQARLMAMLPYPSLSIDTAKGSANVYARISKDENRKLPLQTRRASVRMKLEKAAPGKPSAQKKSEPER